MPPNGIDLAPQPRTRLPEPSRRLHPTRRPTLRDAEGKLGLSTTRHTDCRQTSSSPSLRSRPRVLPGAPSNTCSHTMECVQDSPATRWHGRNGSSSGRKFGHGHTPASHAAADGEERQKSMTRNGVYETGAARATTIVLSKSAHTHTHMRCGTPKWFPLSRSSRKRRRPQSAIDRAAHRAWPRFNPTALSLSLATQMP